jgi:hypothetical protein
VYLARSIKLKNRIGEKDRQGYSTYNCLAAYLMFS